MIATEIPAAWYPDPAGSDAERWWDGSDWTELLRPADGPQHAASTPAMRDTGDRGAPAPHTRREARSLAAEPVAPMNLENFWGQQFTTAAAPQYSDSVAPEPPAVPRETVHPTPPWPAAGTMAATPGTADAAGRHDPLAEWIASSQQPIEPATQWAMTQPTSPAAPPAPPVATAVPQSTMIAPTAPAVTTEAPTATATLTPPHGTSVVVIPRPTQSANYVAMAPKAVQAPAESKLYEPYLVYTPEVWFIATTPVWTSILQAGAIAVMGESSPFSYFVMIAGWFVTLFLVIMDRQKLLADGYRSAASAWWFVLAPLAYLVARGVHVSRVKRAGWAPLVVYLALTVLQVAAAIALVLWLVSALGSTALIG